jgi:hypothetical protein
MSIKYVWIVINPDSIHTPLVGVWDTYAGANENCPDGYVIVKLKLNMSYAEVETELDEEK